MRLGSRGKSSRRCCSPATPSARHTISRLRPGSGFGRRSWAAAGVGAAGGGGGCAWSTRRCGGILRCWRVNGARRNGRRVERRGIANLCTSLLQLSNPFSLSSYLLLFQLVRLLLLFPLRLLSCPFLCSPDRPLCQTLPATFRGHQILLRSAGDASSAME